MMLSLLGQHLLLSGLQGAVHCLQNRALIFYVLSTSRKWNDVSTQHMLEHSGLY